MLEEKIGNFKKLYSKLVIAAATAVIIGSSSALILGGYTSEKEKVEVKTKTENTRSYVFTVNSENTGVLNKLGWTESPGKADDYAIFDGSMREIKNELEDKKYSILAITGHHNSFLGNYVYGDDGEKVKFRNLPDSKDLEVIMFSACATAGIDGATVRNVYIPLINKYSNLKAITGFTTTSLEEDGVVPKLLLKTSKELRTSLKNYAKSSVKVNPDRVGTLIKVGENRWDYYSQEGVTRLEINKRSYKIL